MNLGQFFSDNESLFKEEDQSSNSIRNFYKTHGLFKAPQKPVEEYEIRDLSKSRSIANGKG